MPEGFEVSDEKLWEATRSDDLDVRADALLSLAERFRFKEDFAEAKNLYAAARELFVELDSEALVARCTYNLGFCHYRLDEYEQAIVEMSKSLASGQEVNNSAAIAYSAGPLADSLSELGRIDEAIAAYQLSVEGFVEIEEHLLAAINSKALGDLHGQSGRTTQALECFIRSYNLFQQIGEAEGAARAKERMAAALIELGDFDQAIAHLRDALKVFEFIEEEERVAYTKYRIGCTLNLAERYDQAEAPLREASRWFRANKLWSKVARTEMNLCEALIFQNPKVENKEAKELLPRVLSFFESAGEHANLLSANSIEATRLLTIGKFPEAVEAWSQILVESINFGDDHYISLARLNLAEALAGDGLISQAKEQLSFVSRQSWNENKSAIDRYEAIQSRLQDINPLG
jgi:tetratricopeptide (TPR) repeat protein